jgi:hypothetical protein
MLIKILGYLPIFILLALIATITGFYIYLLIIGEKFRKVAQRFGLLYTPPSLMTYPTLAGSVENQGFYMGIIEKEGKRRIYMKTFFKATTKKETIYIHDKSKSIENRFYTTEKIQKNILKHLHKFPEFHTIEIHAGHVSLTLNRIILRKKELEDIISHLIILSQKLSVSFQ